MVTSYTHHLPVSHPGPAAAAGDLLQAWHDGSRAAYDRLFDLVYESLREGTGAVLRGQASWQPARLIHRIFERLVHDGRLSPTNRAGFYAFAAQVMRRLLVDAAHPRSDTPWAGAARTVQHARPLLGPAAPAPDDLVDFDEALERLERLHPRMARVLTLRVFGGFDDACMADILRTSPASVARDLAAAKQWLSYELHAMRAPGGGDDAVQG